MNSRPSWSDLTPTQQKHFGNGVGPSGAPIWFRALLTMGFDFFFIEASWRHHDFGYAIGKNEYDRNSYDLKFYQAMQRDAAKQPLWKRHAAFAVARLFYKVVDEFGQSNFYYANEYRTLDQILKA